MRFSAALLVVSVPALAAGGSAFAEQDFVAFESGQVRPLALSPDGSRLYAVNTPDNRLEVLDVTPTGLLHKASVPVGMEPVAVALRSSTEVWVVNHLSDSVSVVDVGSLPPRVTATLLVGDEPRDIVFAGPGFRRAFIATAHRGQNRPGPPDFFTPGVGRADIWVFDADEVGSSPDVRPLAILTLFCDTPRALAATPDGRTVYAAAFLSGNRTTAVPAGAIPRGAMPPPTTNVEGIPAPPSSLIVRHDGAHWRDPVGGIWDEQVRFSLPDMDVFAIDAMADPPREIASYPGVGTVLFNMVVNPATGRLYVSNLEARNDVRFEGAGNFAGSTVRGHVTETRITVVDAAAVRPRHLNGHIDYRTTPGPVLERLRSVAFPLGMAVTRDGTTLYVAGFGSGAIYKIPTAALESGEDLPIPLPRIPVAGGGPTGIVLDETRGRLYTLARFDNAVVAFRLGERRELFRTALHNPEPPSLVRGRRIFYDARKSSGHGDASCASCHVFADSDALAWDLGNPDAGLTPNPNPFRFPPGFTPPPFHPMKGPMTTQTLRGIGGTGPLHWRGDRTGGNDPGGDPMDSRAALLQFNGAFVSLLGRAEPLPADEMDALATFLLQVSHPPSPVRNLDNSLTPAQERGRNAFLATRTDAAGPCASCHRLDPSRGEFGTDGMSSVDGLPQLFKIPHLRALYAKVGMFGMPEDPLFQSGDNGFTGDQVRGFGYANDGVVDTLLRFLRARVFSFPGGDAQRRDLAEFLLAFDTGLAPIVGQQVTRTPTNGAVADPRIDLLLRRASVSTPRRECDVIVKGVVAGEARGWARLESGLFRSDRAAEPLLTEDQLRAFVRVPGQELTYTAVPPGSAVRMGIDRDRDGHFDRDELDRGSDPANAKSTPEDRDGDGAPNETDCAPDDPGASAVPGEVTDLAFAGNAWTLAWSSAAPASGPATVHDVARGLLANLPVGSGPGETCVASGTPADRATDYSSPPGGSGYWYLVRARNVCGAGTYGSPKNGEPRVTAACP